MKYINCGDVPGLSPFGVRRTVRRIVAESEVSSWIQKSISFELIENIGVVSSAGAGRCIRISTDGTVINTASYRGENAIPADPLASKLADQLAWYEEAKHSASIVDNQMIFDDAHLTIEATTPQGEETAINDGNDWCLIDLSPITKNNETDVSTSTTLGASIGMFGDVPTVGMDFSTTTSHQWTLPDYGLLAMGGLSGSREPRAVWHVKRSDNKSDPNIARSSFEPHFEVIFGLRHGVMPKRYSSISVMLDVSFLQHVDRTPIEDKIKSLPFGGFFYFLEQPSLINVLLSEVEKAIVPPPNFTRHSFMMTFIVDWKLGTVSACVPDIYTDTVSCGKTPICKIKNIDDPDRNKSDWFLSSDQARELLAPVIKPESVYTDLRLEFTEGSAIGVANPGNPFDRKMSVQENYDILFPIRVLSGYSETFSVYQGYPIANVIKDVQWLPFKRAARISIMESTEPDGHGLIWSAPHGYSRDSVWTKGEASTSSKPFPHIQPYHYSSQDKIGLPEVPDSYYRYNTMENGVRECISFRDRIYLIDGSGITEFNSCFSFLTSAVFTKELSLGIAKGGFVMSADSFRTPLTEKDLEKYKTNNDHSLAREINDFIYGCSSSWILRIHDQILIFADDMIAKISIPDKNKKQGIEYMSWQDLTALYIDEKNNLKDSPSIISSLNMLAKVLSRTGVMKPIAGWVEPDLQGYWIKDTNEMLLQREF